MTVSDFGVPACVISTADKSPKLLKFGVRRAQLVVNVVAVTTAAVGAFALQESPLTAVQMLWCAPLCAEITPVLCNLACTGYRGSVCVAA